MNDTIRDQYPNIAMIADYINTFDDPRAALAVFLAAAEAAMHTRKEDAQ